MSARKQAATSKQKLLLPPPAEMTYHKAKLEAPLLNAAENTILYLCDFSLIYFYSWGTAAQITAIPKNSVVMTSNVVRKL